MGVVGGGARGGDGEERGGDGRWGWQVGRQQWEGDWERVKGGGTYVASSVLEVKGHSVMIVSSVLLTQHPFWSCCWI